MNRTLLHVGVIFFLALSPRSATAQLSSAEAHGYLHFVVVQDTDSVKIRSATSGIPCLTDETRIRCREIELHSHAGKHYSVFVDARVEHGDHWLTGKRITMEHDSAEINFSGVEQMHRKATIAPTFQIVPKAHQQSILDAIDHGLIESAKEHPKIVEHLIQKSSVTGNGKRPPGFPSQLSSPLSATRNWLPTPW